MCAKGLEVKEHMTIIVANYESLCPCVFAILYEYLTHFVHIYICTITGRKVT